MAKTIKNIVSFLNNEFPFKKSEAWDKNGLIFGNPKKEVHKIMLALDLTTKIFEEAIKNRVDLIILHHPFIFESLAIDVAKAPYKKELLHRIQNTNIGVLVLHTCYDQAKKGMAYALARELKAQILKQGQYGAMLQFESQRISNLSGLLNTKFQTPIVVDNTPKDFVAKKIAFIPGAGDIADILNYFKLGADLIITSDIKWSAWVTAQELNINLAQVSHGIEKIFGDHLQLILSKKYKGVTFLLPDKNN